jgi:WS/DGAT/MGAT family acyltransferase
VDRLSALDASFLRVESPSAHMHVGWLALVDLPDGIERLDVEAVASRLRSRLHLVPRFRQVVRRPAPGLAGLAWSDAPHFALDDHLTVDQTARMSPAGLGRLAESFLSEQLPRDRPLWKLHLVPRVTEGRAAVLGKVHHAMVDGIAAVQLGLLLFDGSPDTETDGAVEWEPRNVSGVRMAVDAARDTALEQFRSARRTAALGLSPGRGIRLAETMRRAAFALVDDARRPAPSSYLNVPIGPRRRLVGATLPLERAVAIKERTQTKLNDVVLATVAGALARLAPAHGHEAQDLRAMVPASVRAQEGSAAGNEIAFLFVDLPVSAGAAERLALVHDRMRSLKEAGRVAGTQQVLGLLDLLPGPVQGQAARLAASPRLYNLTVSNVPGPPVPLYLAGGRVRSILPVIPIPERHALAVGALTYERRLHIAAHVDPDALPRASRLPLMVADAFEELDLATRPRLRAA